MEHQEILNKLPVIASGLVRIVEGSAVRGYCTEEFRDSESVTMEERNARISELLGIDYQNITVHGEPTDVSYFADIEQGTYRIEATPNQGRGKACLWQADEQIAQASFKSSVPEWLEVLKGYIIGRNS